MTPKAAQAANAMPKTEHSTPAPTTDTEAVASRQVVPDLIAKLPTPKRPVVRAVQLIARLT